MKLTSETLVHPETAPAAQTALGEAQVRFDRAADRLRLDPGTHGRLRSPMREHRVAVPVRMDDDWSADEVLQKLDAWRTGPSGPCTRGLNASRYHCEMRPT